MAVLTIVTGLVGWQKAGETDFARRLYLTFLAFGGDPIYIIGLGADRSPTSAWLVWTRFLGLATTLTAVLALLSAVLYSSASRLRARWRRGHAVLIGQSVFGLERLQRLAPNRKITILGDRTFGKTAQWGHLHIPVDLDDTKAVLRLIGQPDAIMFGARETVRNVALARAILPQQTQPKRVFLRVEDIALMRDLAQLAPELDQVQPFSSSESVAESVVFSVAVPEMAMLRGQPGVHVLMIGLGGTNLALAEQLAVTCYHPGRGGMDQLRITVLDIDIALAKARLQRQSPGLDQVATIVFRKLDGLDCLDQGVLRSLRAIDRMQPVTTVIISTGDDARNAAIAMRLRQIQLQRLILKAPILVRNRLRSGYAPRTIEDMSGGIYDFGGDRDGDGDPDLERFEDELASDMHGRWHDRALAEWTGKIRYKRPKGWNDLSSAEKRSSRLAARATPFVLRAAGLVPDLGSVEANMHVHPDAVKQLRGHMRDLQRLEHERWMAEKRLDGYVPTTGNALRDDERRRHPALVPWNELSPEDQDKDKANVDLMIAHCRDRVARDGQAWRWRWRVGAIGPISVTEDSAPVIERAFVDYLNAWGQGHAPWPVPLDAATLEILSPDAPGFDRVAAAALARAWKRVTGRGCRLVALRAGSQELLAEMALDGLAPPDSQDGDQSTAVALMTRFARQSEVLAQAVDNTVVACDMRPPDTSDADLWAQDAQGQYSRFYAHTERVASQLDALSDLLVWGAMDGQGAQSRAIAAARATRGGRSLKICLDKRA